MALLNRWAPDTDGGAGPGVALQCDGCLPPRFVFGREAEVRGHGWRFDDLERGPHRCPACPSSGIREHRRSTRYAASALPDFIVIGAAKCGTTSLHRYLSSHPQIQMPEVKEVRFFQDPRWEQRLDSYAELFDASADVRGEATPAYSAHPLIPGIPERISAVVPDVRLIYLVRDPAERAIAAYAESRAQDKESRNADQALADIADPFNPYLAQSRYSMQAAHYLESFPADRLLVVHQRDLLARRPETLRRVFGFLGVDPEFTSERFEELANVRSTKRSRGRLGRALRRSRFAGAVARIPKGPREALLRPYRALTSRELDIEVSAEVRALLEDELGGELDRLAELTA